MNNAVNGGVTATPSTSSKAGNGSWRDRKTMFNIDASLDDENRGKGKSKTRAAFFKHPGHENKSQPIYTIFPSLENQSGIEPLDSTHYLLTGKKSHPEAAEAEKDHRLSQEVLKPLEELNLNAAEAATSKNRSRVEDVETSILDRSRSPLSMSGRTGRAARDSLGSIHEEVDEEFQHRQQILAPETTQESLGKYVYAEMCQK